MLGERLKLIDGIESMFLRKELKVGRFEVAVPFWRDAIETDAMATARLHNEDNGWVVVWHLPTGRGFGSGRDRIVEQFTMQESAALKSSRTATLRLGDRLQVHETVFHDDTERFRVTRPETAVMVEI